MFYASVQIVIDPLIWIVFNVYKYSYSDMLVVDIVHTGWLCVLNNNNNVNNHALVQTISNQSDLILIRWSFKRLETTVIGQYSVPKFNIK